MPHLSDWSYVTQSAAVTFQLAGMLKSSLLQVRTAKMSYHHLQYEERPYLINYLLQQVFNF